VKARLVVHPCQLSLLVPAANVQALGRLSRFGGMLETPNDRLVRRKINTKHHLSNHFSTEPLLVVSAQTNYNRFITKKRANTKTRNKQNDKSPDKGSLILALITQNKELVNLLASQQQDHKEETKRIFRRGMLIVFHLLQYTTCSMMAPLLDLQVSDGSHSSSTPPQLSNPFPFSPLQPFLSLQNNSKPTSAPSQTLITGH